MQDKEAVKMAQKDCRTVLTELRKNSVLERFYYIYGENVSDVERVTKAVIEKAVGDNVDFALTKINGSELNVSDFIDIIQMMPMMSEYNCVLVNDYNCEEQREDMNKRVVDALKDIPQQTVVIFNVTGFEVKSKKGKITDKNKKIGDLAVKNGIACECTVKTPQEIAKDIATKVSSRSGMITLDTAYELAVMCMCDTLMIDNEIDKLCAYANGREITSEMLHLLVPQQHDFTVYNLARAVSSFNRKESFEILNELWEKTPLSERRGLISSITSSFIDLYRSACAIKVGKNYQNVVADYGYRYDFVVKIAFQNSARIPIERLRRCIIILRDTVVTMNSTGIDERIVLEEAVTKMLMTRKQ
jgi:DNA polymerase-3 subunit delta